MGVRLRELLDKYEDCAPVNAQKAEVVLVENSTVFYVLIER